MTLFEPLSAKASRFARLLVVDQGIVKMTGIRFLLDRRQHGVQGVLDGAEQAEVEGTAIAERFRPHVDLRDLRPLRKD